MDGKTLNHVPLLVPYISNSVFRHRHSETSDTDGKITNHVCDAMHTKQGADPRDLDH